jgi:hypothetical protein
MSKPSTVSRTCDLCGQTHIGIAAPRRIPPRKYMTFRDRELGYHCRGCGTFRCRSCWLEMKQPRCSQCERFFEQDMRPLLPPDVDFEALMAIKTPSILTQMVRTLKPLGARGVQGEVSDGVGASRARDRELKAIPIPNRAPVNDLWPGRCSSCHQETDNPYSFVLYSANRVSLHKQHYSHGVSETVQYSDIQEHPCRVCGTCAAASRDLGRAMKIAIISAVLAAVFVFLAVMSQEYEICPGLLFGLGAFVVAFGLVFILVYGTRERQPYQKAQANVSAYRELRKGSKPGEYVVLSEERFRDLQRSGMKDFGPRE